MVKIKHSMCQKPQCLFSVKITLCIPYTITEVETGMKKSCQESRIMLFQRRQTVVTWLAYSQQYRFKMRKHDVNL